MVQRLFAGLDYPRHVKHALDNLDSLLEAPFVCQNVAASSGPAYRAKLAGCVPVPDHKAPVPNKREPRGHDGRFSAP